MESGSVDQITDFADPGIENRLADWSPDGERIVFVSADASGVGHLFTATRSGTELRQVTREAAVFESPAWSPDDEWIATEMAVAGDWGLYLLRPDGTELHRVGQPGVNLFQPSWLSDSRKIAVITGDERAWRLGLLNLETNHLEVLTGPGFDIGSVKSSPSGEGYAVDVVAGTNSDLYLLEANGTIQRRLTEVEAVDARPDWSPDGKRIVFHSTRDYGSVGGEERWSEFELYVMDLASGEIRRLTRNRHFDAHPEWCPAAT